ncbi:hypothetical protein AGMMS49965_04760 [Bacteroidia bacterium]|nr:hypothetical protein AGMMS49965_04760 [Bacteroidia bacterium]
MKQLQYIAGIALLAGASLFAGCITPQEEDDGEHSSLTVSVGESSLRTLTPDRAQFTRFELSFSHPTATKAPLSFAPNAGAQTVELVAGNWTITASAFKDDTKLAQGSTTATVVMGANTSATIPLAPILNEDAMGRFALSVWFPPTVSSASLSFTGINGTMGGGIYPMPPAEIAAGNWADTWQLPAGYYRMNLQLTSGTLTAGKTEVVHIYPEMTTATPAYSFTEADFMEGATEEELAKQTEWLCHTWICSKLEIQQQYITAEVNQQYTAAYGQGWQDVVLGIFTNMYVGYYSMTFTYVGYYLPGHYLAPDGSIEGWGWAEDIAPLTIKYGTNWNYTGSPAYISFATLTADKLRLNIGDEGLINPRPAQGWLMAEFVVVPDN